jgi:hypothetical protein
MPTIDEWFTCYGESQLKLLLIGPAWLPGFLYRRMHIRYGSRVAFPSTARLSV